MTRFARARLLVGVVLAGAIAILGLTACGPSGSNAESVDADLTDIAWDGQALQAIGYTTEDVTLSDPQAAPTATPGQDRRELRHKRLRYAFRNTLHAEAVVQTDEGTKTVVAQRGTVTAVNGTSITVKSTDGFTLTWTISDKTTVIVKRVKGQIGDVSVGTQVGVAGAKDGNATNARLVVVPVKQS
jgi:ABC-type transport system substrate-binding protein